MLECQTVELKRQKSSFKHVILKVKRLIERERRLSDFFLKEDLPQVRTQAGHRASLIFVLKKIYLSFDGNDDSLSCNMALPFDL